MHCSIKNTRSFINKLKRRGPSIELCSTPAITPLSELNLLTYFHPHRGRTFPHSYTCSAASFSRKPILCETSIIFYSQKYQVWQKDNKKFLKFIKNEHEVMLDSFRNFAHISSYLHSKSFTWKRGYITSQKLQMQQILPRPFCKAHKSLLVTCNLTAPKRPAFLLRALEF